MTRVWWLTGLRWMKKYMFLDKKTVEIDRFIPPCKSVALSFFYPFAVKRNKFYWNRKFHSWHPLQATGGGNEICKRLFLVGGMRLLIFRWGSPYLVGMDFPGGGFDDSIHTFLFTEDLQYFFNWKYISEVILKYQFLMCSLKFHLHLFGSIYHSYL